MADFQMILAAILSPDNDTRNQAEEQFNKLSLDVKLPHLVSTLRTEGAGDEVKAMAAILLRRIFLQLEYKDIAEDLPPDVLAASKAELFLALQSENSALVRKKICDAVAEMGRSFLDENEQNQWPELLQFLFQCCNLQQPNLYSSALHIISVVPGVFGNQLQYCVSSIKQLLLQALKAQQTEIWSEAFKATVAFVVFLDTNTLRNGFKDLLQPLLEILNRSIEQQEDETLLKSFIDLGDHCPKFLRSQLENILELMLKVMGTESLDDSWKQLALELVVTIAENAPAMMRKHSNFFPRIVSQGLQFMLEVVDDEDWLTADSADDDEDNTSNAVAGETSLDRLATALGGKAILPHIIANVPQMLQSEDWRYRYAALMAISAVGEGCHKQMTVILDEVVNAVLPFCQDPHHRVRYATCNALGQMANDFFPSLQKKCHAQIIPALLIVMEDFDTPRVQTHAGAALVNFCEQCPKSILLNYLDPIIEKLERVLQVRLQELLQKGRKLVLEQIVTTTATVADSVEEAFVPYYDKFMPSLKYIMASATGKEYRMLRGKTIECISLMGLAVGQEKFMQDAQEVMAMLVKVQNEQGDMEPDDPQVSYMISAWARMCKIIGSAFVPYLPVVMGPLLQAASLKPEIAFVDDESEKNFSEEDGWEFITLADQQKFGIKTAGLEEKCTAMQMLVVYAKDLKEGFVDYAEPVATIMVPHLKFFFHELVRAAAAEILPYLLECVKAKGLEAIQKLWGIIADKLLEAIGIEPDIEIVSIMMDSLCKCIEFLGSNCFSSAQYTKLLSLLKDVMEQSFTRASERHARRNDEDYDEQVEEQLEEEDETDEQYLRKVADVMHSLFGTHGSSLLPFFDELLPTFAGMMGEGRPSSHKQWSLCVFDDLLEYASTNAIKYQEYFLQPMMKCICSKSPSVRQAACYGIGVMAQFCSKDFGQACLGEELSFDMASVLASHHLFPRPVGTIASLNSKHHIDNTWKSLPLLTMAVQMEGAREDIIAINATENAISAVAKVCKYVESVPLEKILPIWLSWLPVVEDKEEAPHVYDYLCDLIESNNPLILGSDNTNVPRLLCIVAEVCVQDVLEDNQQVFLRLIAIARHIQASGEQVWTACLQLLTDKQREALLTVLA